MKKGIFITLEGGEGVGKSTVKKYVIKFLEDMGYDCLWTREPGGTKIGEQIRDILVDSKNKGMDPRTELLLYLGSRVPHIHTVINPALAVGKFVISDRFRDSSSAYQGYMRGLGVDFVLKAHEMFDADLKPDLTFLFDLPPEVGVSRSSDQLKSSGRWEKESRFEQEGMDTHEKILEGFYRLARKEPERWVVIDVKNNKPQQVADIICSEIQKRFLKK